jgi:Flp pilus assembly pilin Flp
VGPISLLVSHGFAAKYFAAGYNLELTTTFSHGMIVAHPNHSGGSMAKWMKKLWSEEEGQDIAEYAVMLAVILVLVVGTVRLIGSSSNNVFSSVASSIGQ